MIIIATITKGEDLQYRWTGNLLLFHPPLKTRDTEGGGTWTFSTLFWWRFAKIAQSGSKGLSSKESYVCLLVLESSLRSVNKKAFGVNIDGTLGRKWKIQKWKWCKCVGLNSNSSKDCVFEKQFLSVCKTNHFYDYHILLYWVQRQ